MVILGENGDILREMETLGDKNDIFGEKWKY